ncbi:MAG: hypothetical protein ABSF58_04220 [Solirubrobacteraceae bacterium]
MSIGAGLAAGRRIDALELAASLIPAKATITSAATSAATALARPRRRRALCDRARIMRRTSHEI